MYLLPFLMSSASGCEGVVEKWPGCARFLALAMAGVREWFHTACLPDDG